MKKKIIIISSIIISVILIIGLGIFGYFYIKDKYYYDKYLLPDDVFVTYNETVELFEEESFNDLITNTNAEIISDDESIDTETIGRRKHKLTIKYDDKEYYYQMAVQVLDVTPPKFISAPSVVTTTVMNVAYPCDKAVYGDDYDSKPSCWTEGDVDFENTGSYDLQYILKDSSGNTTTKDVTLKVVPYGQSTSSNNSTTTPIYFSDVIKEYKNGNTMIGIDVSKWQGNIDWQKVKDAGCEFAILRIGVQAGKDRDYSIDGNYEKYIQGAKEAGLKVGVYVYTTALNYNDGVKCAEWVINTLNGEKLDLGVSYDWENYSYFMGYGVSFHTLSMGYQGFKKTLESGGYEAHFYASKFYLENFWMGLDNESIWLAHYTSTTNYEGKYFMWQRTGNGKIDGISDNYVDIDILYK